MQGFIDLAIAGRGVTVLNTSSFPEYTKVLAHNLNTVKISASAIGLL